MKTTVHRRGKIRLRISSQILLTTKLTMIILLAAFMQVSAEAYGQTVTLRSHNTALRDVFTGIKKQTGYVFFYTDRVLKDAGPVSVDLHHVTVQEAVRQCLQNQPFDFHIEGKTVFITKKPAEAPKKDTVTRFPLHGIVKDEMNHPLAGVTVRVVGTNQGTLTDDNGQYTLQVALRDSVEFSYIGYQRQVHLVGGHIELNVVLKAQSGGLNEVVVVGYGKQKKISLVGSEASIKPEDLETSPVRSLSTALAGKLAGIVSVQRSGEPGQDDAQVWIRGISTFDASMSYPLVLVDGVPRDYNNINPEDIESFTILKDAAATAVYGVRGANGVILIHTKGGEIGKPKIKFRYDEGVTQFTKLPDFADGVAFMKAANDALAGRGQDVLYTQDEMEKTKDRSDPDLYPDVDWYKTIFKNTGHTRQANLNISGGSQNAVYYVSATYYNEVGLFRTDQLAKYNSQISENRYNMTANLSLHPTKTTELKLGVQGYLSEGNFPGTAGSTIYSDAYFSTPVSYPPQYSDGKYSNVTPGTILYNPYVELTQTGYITNAASQLNSNIQVIQDLSFLTKGLSVNTLFAFDAYNFVSEHRYKRPDTYFATGRDSTGALIYGPPEPGQEFLNYTRDNSGNRSIYTQTQLNYQRDFGLHSVGAMLLYDQSDHSDTHTNDFISSLPHRYRGFAGRATYGYDERYFVEFNFGYNGSENFAPNKRYGFFPSFGAGWAISNESFFKPAKSVFQLLKFRFSYGTVGNSNIPGRRFAYIATVNNSATGYTYGQSLGTYISGTAFGDYASDVSWEKSLKSNLGIDIWTLSHTLNLTVDLFKEHRTGIFLQRNDMAAFVGIPNTPYGNVGIVDNKGLDASLKYSGKFGKVGFQVMANVNFNRNLDVADALPPWKYPWLEHRGRVVGQRFGYIALGLFRDSAEILNSAKQTGDVRPGDIKFQDINGDGVINPDDRMPIGYGSVPEWTYGFGITLNYKAFTLTAFFQGIGNVDIYLSGEGFQPFLHGMERGNLYSNIGDRWTPGNPDLHAFYPRLGVGNVNDNFTTNSWWLRNGRYMRLKNAQLTYQLPDHWQKAMHLQHARIFLAGVNLLTFSPFKLWDVELGDGRGASYPNITTYSAGLELSF